MYSASIRNNGDSRHHARTKDYQFVIDTDGQGANPVETVLAGLCGCIGHYVVTYVHREGIDPKGFAVKAEAELTEDRTRLADIRLIIDMQDTKLDGQQSEDIVKYVQACPVHTTLKANSRITIALAGHEN